MNAGANARILLAVGLTHTIEAGKLSRCHSARGSSTGRIESESSRSVPCSPSPFSNRYTKLLPSLETPIGPVQISGPRFQL